MTVAPHIDLNASDFYVHGARKAYAWMRQNAPVHRDANSGLWGIATYDLVLEAERDAVTFSNAGGSRPDTGPLPWMLDMDAPEHLKRRKLVRHAFTPNRVRTSGPRIALLCDDLIDRVCERGECDFVHDLAAPLPMIVIGDMLGVPPEDRDKLLRWSDDMLGSLKGDEASIQAAATSFTEYMEYAQRMADDRRANPTDDLVSVLVHAEVDGDRLADQELLFEILLLLVGGDESTRNVTTGGMEQFLKHPEQKQRLIDDPTLLGVAVEEILRWVSPIKTMNRTLTRDVEFGGVQLRAGDKALLLYESANFDETRFADPERFDITRTPNDHLAFGAGPHFCIGASLARLELATMFERLWKRLPDIELATADPLPRTILGISEMAIRFTPRRRVAG